MIAEITNLKQAVIAYKAALEFDYCPEPSKAGKVRSLLGGDLSNIKQALSEHQGRRPDEIANSICDLVENL